jgi:hypothetical protein
MKRFLLAAAVACCLGAVVSPAQAVVIGTADTTNSYPFGSSGGGYYYQQIYSAASFTAPLNINQITFYNSLSPSTSTPLSDTFTVYLSTSSAAISTFDTSAFAFPDATFTQVFSDGLSAIVNGQLNLALTSAFNYNPALGNLVLTVRDFTAGSGGNLFLDADQNVGTTNMRISAFPYDFNQGLVTGFNADATAVPEPATWAMMIAGFGLVGVSVRRKRRGSRAVATYG